MQGLGGLRVLGGFQEKANCPSPLNLTHYLALQLFTIQSNYDLVELGAGFPMTGSQTFRQTMDVLVGVCMTTLLFIIVFCIPQNCLNSDNLEKL